MRAYNELYLSDAKNRLADIFDYAIRTCGMDADAFSSLFARSEYGQMFERGNPSVIAGMSGVEIAERILRQSLGTELPEPRFEQDRSPEYWAGWALAEYQWHTGRRFKDIFAYVPLSRIIDMYPVYHEMDVRQFVRDMELAFQEESDSKLKHLRENRGLSQHDLAERTGVNLRSIQTYEQQLGAIDKAQAHKVYKLAMALSCNMEDLLENPLEQGMQVISPPKETGEFLHSQLMQKNTLNAVKKPYL